MTTNTKITVLAGATAALAIVALIYGANVRSELESARQETSALQQKLQSLNAIVATTEAGRTSALEERDRLKVDFAASKTELTLASTHLTEENEELKKQLAVFQNDLAYRNKVAGWWRDLFDYSKPFNRDGGLSASSLQGTVASSSK